MAEDLKEKLAYDETFSCVQCGYCLPTCPTYVAFETETHSPRGRINLVKMAAEGKISLDEIRGPIELCLGCRACETVCPTNVEYGKIFTSAINVLTDKEKQTAKKSTLTARKWMFEKVLPNQTLLNTAGKGLFLYQKTRAYKLVRGLRLNYVLPKAVRQMEKITPKVAPAKKRKRTYPKAPTKPVIGFFSGCVMDTFFAKINDLAIKLLELAGYEVITIKEQTCCGALQHHAGEHKIAKGLAMKNIEAFEAYQFDYVINTIGGCGAALVEYPLHFTKDDPWHRRAEIFASKNKDISYLLAKADLPMDIAIDQRVAYQPSCHLTNVQKVVNEPLQLMKQVKGIEFLALPEANLCCGSAGIYNVIHYERSMQVLDLKINRIKEIKPTMIVTSNPGCHLQMLQGVEREQLTDQVEVVHLVELLARACGIEAS
ncbi:(Fe-S)-binding protein [Ornithinibacillus sp. 4-3]|uniref:Glycolate oxidase iron-sulfur subunit n=1 Tax=Ornithinibacillus sp. 4-3 TaxID=3231488 RepID=A0AB39HMN1_9BACI